MVTTTGMISPSSFAVFALKFLQKSMMFTPWGPSAVPTGGAGVALPAEICSFTIACIFFAIALRSGGYEEQTRPTLSSVSRRPGPAFWTWRQRSNLLDLQEIQFHRRRAAEDRDHHLQR